MPGKIKGAAPHSSDGAKADRISLKRKSMLEAGANLHDEMRKLKLEDLGKDHLTFLQRPYARATPEIIAEKSSVWFTAYMPSILGQMEDGEMTRPLETLCDLKLWSCFAELGVKAVHTGPVMKAGGFYRDRTPYPSIDGWFDPIALEIDPELGSERDYSTLVWIAENTLRGPSQDRLEAIVVGDIVPGHTGMGADFHLALQGADHYPGLYVLARVDQILNRQDKRHKSLSDSQIGKLLSGIPEDAGTEFTRLLTKEEVDALVGAKVIPGTPQRPMGAQAGAGWSITAEIEGVPDEGGITRRRWVYLHFFHPKQPTLNFFDPGYAAWRLVTGQLNYMLWHLRSTGIRLDANAFLGIEPRTNTAQPAEDQGRMQTWSEAHPLSNTVTNMLAWQARRLNGFSFQEMNMAVPDIAKSGEFGPDLAYDFITRPACEHALLTGDVSLLEFMFAEMKAYGVNPRSLVHALQNHDEFTYELVHLLHTEEASHNANHYSKNAKTVRAEMRREALHRFEPLTKLGEREITDFYNKESPNGLCATVAGLISASLGCKTLEEAEQKKDEITRGHLLLAAFNALQPGIFAFSGWDLVGSLPLPVSEIPPALLNAGAEDRDKNKKDYRWVNRGCYRLLSNFGGGAFNSEARFGCFGLPEAKALYGPLDRQRLDANSFYSQLKRILDVRSEFNIASGEFAGVLPDFGAGVVGLATWVVDTQQRKVGAGLVLAILNFNKPTTPVVNLNALASVRSQWPSFDLDNCEVVDAFSSVERESASYSTCKTLPELLEVVRLEGWQFKLFHLKPQSTTPNSMGS